MCIIYSPTAQCSVVTEDSVMNRPVLTGDLYNGYIIITFVSSAGMNNGTLVLAAKHSFHFN